MQKVRAGESQALAHNAHMPNSVFAYCNPVSLCVFCNVDKFIGVVTQTTIHTQSIWPICAAQQPTKTTNWPRVIQQQQEEKKTIGNAMHWRVRGRAG